MSAQVQDLTDLASRICRLEAQNRKLRRCIMGMATISGLLLATGLYLRGSELRAALQSATSRPAAPVLTATQVRIVDDSGNVRAWLGVSNSDEGRLVLLDHGGRVLLDAPNNPPRARIMPVQR